MAGRLYDTLLETLVTLPSALVRLTLGYCHPALLYVHTGDSSLLPALSGIYSKLPPSLYADQDFLQHLCVGMQLDVLHVNNCWRTGEILRIDEHNDGESTYPCDDCCYKSIKPIKRTWLLVGVHHDCGGGRWIPVHCTCDGCGKSLGVKLRPYLSAWQDHKERHRVEMIGYLNLGIHYPRPYLGGYRVQFRDIDSAVRLLKPQRMGSVVHEYNLKTMTPNQCCSPSCRGALDFIALTCDDNGCIYALTGPCFRLFVITLAKDGSIASHVHYILTDIACGNDAKGFIMSIDDSTVTLRIQQLAYNLGVVVACTYSFALPQQIVS